MPWGWECRSKLIKQIPPTPAERKQPVKKDVELPGPNAYESPSIFCGKGYSKIKRSPAYTFGHLTPASFNKPAATARAPLFNIQGLARKGRYRITHSVMTPQLEDPLANKMKVPGPGAYAPRNELRLKRAPAYSVRHPAKPPYQPFDMWTPSPNMYWPPIPCKAAPAFSIPNVVKELRPQMIPGPGEHDPNFNFVKNTKPAFSFGAPFRTTASSVKTPAPNTYCEKKFDYIRRWPPAPSFGIRHTKHLGKPDVYEKRSSLELVAKDT